MAGIAASWHKDSNEEGMDVLCEELKLNARFTLPSYGDEGDEDSDKGSFTRSGLDVLEADGGVVCAGDGDGPPLHD